MKKLMATAVALTIATLASGCAGNQPPEVAPPAAPPARGCAESAALQPEITGVGIIVGNRANTQLAGSEVLACTVDAALNRPSHLVVVSADGRPAAVFDQRLPEMPDGRRRSETYAQARSGLQRALATPAVDPEVDVLESVAIVAGAMRGDAGEHRIVINDSLLQTTGMLPMQRGYLYADPADVFDELRPQLESTIGDLAGFEIVLLAPGASAPPQEAVSRQNRARLVQLFRVIIEGLNGTVVTDPGTVFVDPAPSAGPRPPVTVVPMAPPKPPEPPRRCTEVLDARSVAFVANSAEFLDREEALATIKTAAARIARCPGRITLTGTTSSAGTEAGRRQVSTARAKAVRAVLADALGVPPATIRAVGVGMRFPGYVNDRRPDGTLDSVRARRNRLVIINVR